MLIIKKITSLLLILTLGVTLFTGCKKTQEKPGEPDIKVEPHEYNYLTGLPFASGMSDNSRPVAVMINNAKAALPQSGLTNADIIYEMVTEGGVTRLMALYSDINNVGKVGPVRSARDQFIEFMLPLNAVYVHIGTSTSAKDMLNFYSYQDIDGIYLGSVAFEFDSERNKTKGAEHCWFTNSDLIKAGVNQTGIKTQSNFYPAFEFVPASEKPRVIEGKAANTISFNFSDYADVSITYDTATNKYMKYAFGAPQIDQDTNLQLSFDNVVILLTDIGVQPNGVLADVALEKGKGYYFNGGKYEAITWEKGEPNQPLILKNSKKDLLKVNPGKSYVAVLGNDKVDTLAISEDVSTVASVERVQ
ncbi:MAG: DUF3048 domain-containing protein [Oscillospiraceae bacterium]